MDEKRFDEESYEAGEVLSDDYTRKNRVFPKKSAFTLALLVLIQIALILYAVNYTPTPQDKIMSYSVSVSPRQDGTLDVRYELTWQAIDTDEDLTWIKVGAANPNFSVTAHSDNIASAYSYESGDYIRLDLARSYRGGETFTFWFEINQKQMLCDYNGHYLYEFIPGWFNSTPVSAYSFKWQNDENVTATNSDGISDGYFVWKGSMETGTYVNMRVEYKAGTFTDAATVQYAPFNADGVYDELGDDKNGVIVLVVFICLGILIFEIYTLDSFVSYGRGRGFIRGYGYYVHVYGRTNPYYTKEANKHQGTGNSHGGGHGGGCACACACACAGGGRAGCSQKDTYKVEDKSAQDKSAQTK